MKASTRPDPLKRYRAKRNFARTAEPKPVIEAEEGSRFVVQKHDARRLHYDLRLELDGVLLSWAVPHGPSLVSSEKRLAVRTEDHPLKYLTFEGVIPEGEYGGGTMIVWDRGTWRPLHDPHKSLAKGHIEFELNGERLKGRWHLVRLRPRPREKTEQWLLIKGADEYERTTFDPDILAEEETSVLSGRRNDDLSSSDAIREDHKSRAEIVAARPVKLPDASKIKGARKALLPLFVEPELASMAEQPPAGSQWWHEIKFDGYRAQARVDGRDIKILTRTGLNWTDRFSPIADAVGALGLGSAILDGEIVVEDAAGLSSFNELVGDLKSGRTDRFRYYVFDVLYLNGADLRNASLADRKEALAGIFATPPPARLALSEHFVIDGAQFFEHVSRLGLEGMISKRFDRPYRSGRSNDWLKSKSVSSQEFVVVGFVPSTTAKRAIGSLALGYYEKDKLIHAGRVGSGFAQDETTALYAALEKTKIDKPVFGRKLAEGAEKGVRWVEPKLVAQVEYRGWSREDLLMHSTFRGLRDDKDPRRIVREAHRAAAKSSEPTPMELTHPERMLWPADGITKQGLADYYTENAERILPHLKGRPLSLVRCPGGIDAECFFAKHAWAGLDNSVRRVKADGAEPFLVVDNLRGLLALVQGNVLEIHPWGSTIDDLERPDRLIFDLDPGEGVPWSAVIEAAHEVRQRLRDRFKLESFVKTTGGKGLHVVTPLVRSVNWDVAKAACRQLAEAMESDSPQRYLAHMAKSARKGRIFVDYLRNSRGATAVSAFSTRARAGATVSTPLGWDELSDAIKSDHFRVGNIGRRLAYLREDPWAAFFTTKRRLSPAKGGAKRSS